MELTRPISFRLVIHRGRAVFGLGYGLWLPRPIMHLVADVWNFVACRILGHWYLDIPDIVSGECAYCCKKKK